MTLRIDEINQPFSADTFINTYFRPMRISEERKEKREDAAHSFNDTLLFLFALISAYQNYGVDWEVIEYQFRIEFEQAALRYSRNTPYLQAYIDEKTSDFIDTTREQDLSDPYWLSDERAAMEAVNDANDVVGYEELQQAIDDGYKYKVWRGLLDSRERKSHVKMEGKKLPISEYFDLDRGSLLFPGDYMNCPAESVNCRCSLEYMKG